MQDKDVQQTAGIDALAMINKGSMSPVGSPEDVAALKPDLANAQAEAGRLGRELGKLRGDIQVALGLSGMPGDAELVAVVERLMAERAEAVKALGLVSVDPGHLATAIKNRLEEPRPTGGEINALREGREEARRAEESLRKAFQARGEELDAALDRATQAEARAKSKEMVAAGLRKRAEDAERELDERRKERAELLDVLDLPRAQAGMLPELVRQRLVVAQQDASTESEMEGAEAERLLRARIGELEALQEVTEANHGRQRKRAEKVEQLYAAQTVEMNRWARRAGEAERLAAERAERLRMMETRAHAAEALCLEQRGEPAVSAPASESKVRPGEGTTAAERRAHDLLWSASCHLRRLMQFCDDRVAYHQELEARLEDARRNEGLLAASRRDADALRQELATIKARLELKAEVDESLATRYERARQQAEELRQRVAKLERDLADMTASRDGFRARWMQAQADADPKISERKRLQAQADSLGTRARVAEVELASANAQLEVALIERDRARAVADGLRQQLADLQADRRHTAADALRRRLEAAREELRVEQNASRRQAGITMMVLDLLFDKTMVCGQFAEQARKQADQPAAMGEDEP